MLLVHVPKLTNRLGYTLNVLLKHVLHMDFSITTDEAYFLNYGDAKFSYGPHRIDGSPHLKSCRLLFETSIEDQEPHPFQHDGQWMLFPVYGRDIDLPFDPLAATFFMVSRYEEYLPHRKDIHGRFMSEDHLAVTAGFKDEPVVEQWALILRDLLASRYPDMHIPPRSYRYVQTIDIDAAWCYLHKGVFRTTTGIARDLFWRHDPTEVRRRIRVLSHREKDPFESFDFIISHHSRSENSSLIFFALLADYDNFDKPSSYQNPHTRSLLQHLDDYALMGLHPGYYSIEQPQKVDIERQRLEQILHRPMQRSRYHFLRLQLPISYRILLHAGIRDDYSMGYADTTGFRAGISTPYPFYDLERDHETELIIHPFCVMDTTLQKYMQLTPEDGMEHYTQLIDAVRRIDGTFSCIAHNQNLTSLYGWDGWSDVYASVTDIAKP